MTMLDDTTAIVYNHTDLANALSLNNGVEHVYLGNNITMTSGILVNTAKTRLVIDGLYQEISPEIRTLTDSGPDGGQINVNGSQNLEMTFTNLTIYGLNFYGMPYVHNYSGSANVTLNYQNVTYTGPQITYHRSGLVRYIDCDITLEHHGWSAPGEVAELNRVEIGGTTTMVKTNNSDGIFWMLGTNSSYIKILADASVSISTTYYFLYEDNPPDFIIEPGASLTLNTGSGFSWTNGHTIKTLTLGENAVFKYTQTSNRSNYAAINLEGEARIGAGAVFYMKANFANAGQLIRFTGGSGGLYLENPGSFALYNGPSSSAPVFAFSAWTPFEIIGNQVNYWLNPTSFPVAGTFEDEPLHKWNRPEWGGFTLRGRANGSQTDISYHDFTDEELEDLPPLSALILHLPKVFSAGCLPLEVNPVVLDTRPISGSTTGGARVRAVYVSRGDSLEDDADDTGHYALEQPDPVPFTNLVTVSSNTPFMVIAMTVETQEDGELYILSAPEYIRFAHQPLSGFAGTVLPRKASDDDSVFIKDERLDKTDWVIWLSADGPLRTTGGEALDGALVFGLENGSLITLGTTPQSIHTGEPFFEEEKEVPWAINRGVLMQVTAPIHSGVEYTAQLIWEVYPEDVIPEDEEGEDEENDEDEENEGGED